MAIEYDDLIYTAAHIFVHEGRPFTGITEDLFPNGQLQCRIHFKDGREHGIAEAYFPSGAKKSKTPYTGGAAHGRDTEWFESGAVRIERDIEFGFMIREKVFDESGNLVKEYIRPESDAIMEIIKRRRGENPML
jgi:antitoxin component YwqK of YwqJK toxin-antitoxin module